MTSLSDTAADGAHFLGLAPFLRLNIAGVDLRPIAQTMLSQAAEHPDDANLWMNLAIVMQCLGQRELGLNIQTQALALQRVFYLSATQQPACLRLLVLMSAGDIAENTPIECVLEDSDIDLIFYYVDTTGSLPTNLPAHDVIMVGMSDSDAIRPVLAALDHTLATCPTPIINAPRHIPSTNRQLASLLLHDAPGLRIPSTQRVTRAQLFALRQADALLPQHLPDYSYPFIVRPIDSQAGRDLARIENAASLTTYLTQMTREVDFFIAQFIDYRSADGLFRKYRIALIEGRPFACHMGISQHWMIHYVNAGMYEDAHKRTEEAHFMESFAEFSLRHQTALNAIYERTQLDYLCIDCAETTTGELLIFEIDHTMVVHAMDPIELFPYKAHHMRKVKEAMRKMLHNRVSNAHSADKAN